MCVHEMLVSFSVSYEYLVSAVCMEYLGIVDKLACVGYWCPILPGWGASYMEFPKY